MIRPHSVCYIVFQIKFEIKIQEYDENQSFEEGATSVQFCMTWLSVRRSTMKGFVACFINPSILDIHSVRTQPLFPTQKYNLVKNITVPLIIKVLFLLVDASSCL